MKRNFHEPRVLRLQSSVGVCGVNYADDVKALQELMMKAGYQTATGRSLKVDGICNNETKEAIIWYQRLLTLSRSGLVQPFDQWFIEALKNASQPEWRPRITSGPLHVREAQFTFDNEGTDILQPPILSVRTLILGSHASYTGLILLLLALRLDVATIWEIEAQVRFLRH